MDKDHVCGPECSKPPSGVLSTYPHTWADKAQQDLHGGPPWKPGVAHVCGPECAVYTSATIGRYESHGYGQVPQPVSVSPAAPFTWGWECMGTVESGYESKGAADYAHGTAHSRYKCAAFAEFKAWPVSPAATPPPEVASRETYPPCTVEQIGVACGPWLSPSGRGERRDHVHVRGATVMASGTLPSSATVTLADAKGEVARVQAPPPALTDAELAEIADWNQGSWSSIAQCSDEEHGTLLRVAHEEIDSLLVKVARLRAENQRAEHSLGLVWAVLHQGMSDDDALRLVRYEIRQHFGDALPKLPGSE